MDSNPTTAGKNTVREYYLEIEREGLEEIRRLQIDITLINRLREEAGNDWEMDELCRSIAFDAVRIIGMYGEEIGDAREALKELV
jgi:hypothetical protein